jgi:hypothetical protein
MIIYRQGECTCIWELPLGSAGGPDRPWLRRAAAAPLVAGRPSGRSAGAFRSCITGLMALLEARDCLRRWP